jgi:hypothetical protein
MGSGLVSVPFCGAGVGGGSWPQPAILNPATINVPDKTAVAIRLAGEAMRANGIYSSPSTKTSVHENRFRAIY